ncbi:MAG: hypothetical protein QOE14_2314, partial [Humisphaera sp.]|nr:hypothetical protein [Humisphaera sp.]
ARGDGGPGAAKLKWGIDWMPADDVLRFRQARGVAAGTGVGAAAKEVDLAAQRVRSAEQALKNANAARALNEAADVQGAQNQLDAANAALVKAQKTLNDANAALNLKKPRWLTKFEPVIPSAPAAP